MDKASEKILQEFIEYLKTVCGECKAVNNFGKEKHVGYSGNGMKKRYVKICRNCGAKKQRFEAIE